MFSKRNAWIYMLGGIYLSTTAMVAPCVWAQASDKPAEGSKKAKDGKKEEGDPLKAEETALEQGKELLLRLNREGRSPYSAPLLQAHVDSIELQLAIVRAKQTLVSLDKDIIDASSEEKRLERLVNTRVTPEGQTITSFNIERYQLDYRLQSLKAAEKKALRDLTGKQLKLDESLLEYVGKKIILLEVQEKTTRDNKELIALKQLDTQPEGVAPSKSTSPSKGKKDKKLKPLNKKEEEILRTITASRRGTTAGEADIDSEVAKNPAKRKARIAELEAAQPTSQQDEKTALLAFGIKAKPVTDAEQERLIKEFIDAAMKAQSDLVVEATATSAATQQAVIDAEASLPIEKIKIEERERKADESIVNRVPDGTLLPVSLDFGGALVTAHKVTNGTTGIFARAGVYINYYENKPKFSVPPPGGSVNLKSLPKQYYLRSGIEGWIGGDAGAGGAFSGAIMLNPIEFKIPVWRWLSLGVRSRLGYYGISQGTRETTSASGAKISTPIPNRDYFAVGGEGVVTASINPQWDVNLGIGGLGLIKPQEGGAAFLLTLGVAPRMPGQKSQIVKKNATESAPK